MQERTEGPAQPASYRAFYDEVHRHDLGDALAEQARSRPRMVAVVDGDVRVTFRELDARVERLTWALAERGVGAEDRIVWLGQNSFRLMEVFLAAARLGAMVMPANWRLTLAEVVPVVEDIDPKVIFWQDGEIGQICRSTRDACPKNRVWLQHDGEDDGGYEAILRRQAPVAYQRNQSADTPFLGIFTASFDGRPNAALLSQNGVMLQGLLTAFSQLIGEESCFLVSGPMFHIGVLQAMFGAFLLGARCVFVARVEAKALLELIQAERITHAYIVQPTVEQMRALNRDGAYDVSSLFEYPDMRDWRTTSVTPPAAPLMRALGGYGQTELTGLAVMAWYGGVGAGRPAPFVSIAILDDEGKELADGEVGEICARGPLVMSGYYNRLEENTRRSSHGWHRTHDLGFRKEDGSVAFVGPKTTMIKSGLENIYPAEVENCIRAHPAVQDVCVIGVPDERWTQSVKAVVILKEGASADEAELIEHCRERIASYRKPRIVEFVSALPRNAVGFVDRAAVDAAHGGGGYPRMGA